jgi:hypothetical protein
MHPNDTKDRFIELRAKGLPLAGIASKLGVSKRTLVDWNRQFQSDIRTLRAVELEALHHKILASHEEDLTRLASVQAKIVSVLAERTMKWVETEDLLRFFLLYRREIEKTQLELAPLNQAPPAAPPSPPAAQPVRPANASTADTTPTSR